MSDTDPTASVHAASQSIDSNGKPIRPKYIDARQDVAGDWFTIICILTGLAAIIAFIGVGNAFPQETSFGDGTKFNPVAGVFGALAAVMGWLPFIGIFAVLRAPEASTPSRG